jgi:hypothetical protein
MPDDHKKLFLAATLALILFAFLVGLVHADNVTQPASTAAQGEHMIFLENMVFAIACFFTLIFGAVTGYAFARKHDQVNL